MDFFGGGRDDGVGVCGGGLKVQNYEGVRAVEINECRRRLVVFTEARVSDRFDLSPRWLNPGTILAGLPVHVH